MVASVGNARAISRAIACETRAARELAVVATLVLQAHAVGGPVDAACLPRADQQQRERKLVVLRRSDRHARDDPCAPWLVDEPQNPVIVDEPDVLGVAGESLADGRSGCEQIVEEIVRSSWQRFRNVHAE